MIHRYHLFYLACVRIATMWCRLQILRIRGSHPKTSYISVGIDYLSPLSAFLREAPRSSLSEPSQLFSRGSPLVVANRLHIIYVVLGKAIDQLDARPQVWSSFRVPIECVPPVFLSCKFWPRPSAISLPIWTRTRLPLSPVRFRKAHGIHLDHSISSYKSVISHIRVQC